MLTLAAAVVANDVSEIQGLSGWVAHASVVRVGGSDPGIVDMVVNKAFGDLI